MNKFLTQTLEEVFSPPDIKVSKKPNIFNYAGTESADYEEESSLFTAWQTNKIEDAVALSNKEIGIITLQN